MADEFCLKMPDFHVTFRDLLQAVNLRHGTNGFTSLLKEGVLRVFSPWKIRRLLAGFEPANLGTKGKHHTCTPTYANTPEVLRPADVSLTYVLCIWGNFENNAAPVFSIRKFYAERRINLCAKNDEAVWNIHTCQMLLSVKFFRWTVARLWYYSSTAICLLSSKDCVG